MQDTKRSQIQTRARDAAAEYAYSESTRVNPMAAVFIFADDPYGELG